MIVSAIVATAKNNVIGKDNGIPWYLPADLKFFKRTTLNRHIIMGRKTYESIGHPLPKRTNIIITRNLYYVISNCLVAHSIEEALAIAKDNDEVEVFIIGGSEIYKKAMPFLDRIYLTEVNLEIEGDTFFLSLSPSEWKEVSSETHLPDEKNKYEYTFKLLERKK